MSQKGHIKVTYLCSKSAYMMRPIPKDGSTTEGINSSTCTTFLYRLIETIDFVILKVLRRESSFEAETSRLNCNWMYILRCINVEKYVYKFETNRTRHQIIIWNCVLLCFVSAIKTLLKRPSTVIKARCCTGQQNVYCSMLMNSSRLWYVE